jgi:membrane fusion protein (multidrug efflux system)
MKKSRMQSLAAILGTTATIFGLTSCGNSNQQQMDMTPEIATLTVAEGSSDLASNFAATIKGKTDIEVRPLVSGFITQVHVDEGQRVSKGQVLFTLDQVQYQAAVDQAAASVNSARTALESAKLTAANKQALFDKNIISEYENQLAKNQLTQAQAALTQAQAALTTAKKNLSYTVVTAPSDGFVGSIPNREGSLASPSMVTPLTTVSDNSDVYAYFCLNEKDILELTQNGSKTLNQAIAEMPKVQLELSDGTVYPELGTVATVSGVIDSSTGAANVRARFKNTNGMLRSGSTGRIYIPNHLDNVILIPQKATFEIQDRRFVYVVNDSSKTVSTPIEVSPLNDGQQYVVTSGLTAGQRIVVEGVGTKVKEGMAIKPVDAAAKAAAADAQAAQQAAK